MIYLYFSNQALRNLGNREDGKKKHESGRDKHFEGKVNEQEHDVLDDVMVVLDHTRGGRELNAQQVKAAEGKINSVVSTAKRNQ